MALEIADRGALRVPLSAQFTYVHEWQDGDLVIWDNHAVQHGRPEVGHDDARALRRVCVGPEQDLSLFNGRRVS